MNALAVTDHGEPVGYSTLFTFRAPGRSTPTRTTRSGCGRIGATAWGRCSRSPNLRQLERLPIPDIAARRWLHTYTAQGNAPMQAVNARFGFRRVDEAHEFERAGASVAGRS